MGESVVKFLKGINMKVVAEMAAEAWSDRTPCESLAEKSYQIHLCLLFHVVVLSGVE